MLIEMLRNSLEHIEASEHAGPLDPSLAELKRTIVLTIAEHEERERERHPKAA